MIPESIYEVTRADYISFLEQLKPECRKVEVVNIGKRHKATKVFSKKTNKCLCSRVSDITDDENQEPEVYYIFELPDSDERLPPIPKMRITLKNKEEVQKFFDYFSKKQKENNSND